MQLFGKSTEQGEQFKELLKSVKHEIELDKWENSHHLNLELTRRETETITQLKQKGYHVIPNFIDPLLCEQLIAEIQQAHKSYRDYLWVDEKDSDHRLFGINRLSDLAHQFYTDSFVQNITAYFEKTENYKGFTMGAELKFQPNNPGSGDGWHRDRTDKRQIKFILYLNEVTENNGPFQYYEGSHTPESILHGVLDHGFKYNQNRFTDAEIELLNPEMRRTAVGKAGTLLIADTRGIHRGMPMNEGKRFILMNYTWRDSIPKHIKKLLVPVKAKS